jgi:cysteine desulfurase
VIYLDHHAATPLQPDVLRAMDEARAVGWANPSSVHAAGRRSRALLEDARRAIAETVCAEPADVVLTSGGTEAVNLAVFGLWPRSGGHVVSTEIEHPAVAQAVARLEQNGARVTRLSALGGVAPGVEALSAALAPDTALVAVQWVNHETGLALPVASYAALCRARGVRLVVDAAQALGKVPIDVRALGADAVAFAASKLGGPHGAGALYVARARVVAPLLAGGGQERGRRPGTPDVSAAAGFGAAARAVPARLAAMRRIARLRDRLEAGLRARGAVVQGAAGERVATVTHVALEGLRGDVLVAALDVEGVCVSSGAACSSGLAEPSPSVLAMYPDAPWRARGALRFSLGPESSDADVDGALLALDRVLARLGRGAIPAP